MVIPAATDKEVDGDVGDSTAVMLNFRSQISDLYVLYISKFYV